METQDPNNTNSPKPESQPALEPIKVGVKDTSGAVIVRPEDVYGKVLPKADSVVPSPVKEGVPLVQKVEEPQVQKPAVPDFPVSKEVVGNATDVISPLTIFDTNAVKPQASAIKTESMVGLGGSEIHSSRGNGKLTALKIITVLGLIVFVLLLVVAGVIYLELVRGIPVIQRITGVNIFEIFVGL